MAEIVVDEEDVEPHVGHHTARGLQRLRPSHARLEPLHLAQRPSDRIEVAGYEGVSTDGHPILRDVIHRPAADAPGAWPEPAPLAQAICERQCTRAPYDGRAVASETLKLLQTAGTLDGVTCHLITDKKGMETVLDYLIEGNTAQMRDAAFMRELIDWIRFNDAHALATRDGLFARSSGNPTLPPWLARRLLPFVMTEKGENDKYAKHIRSSASIAVFAAAKNDKAHWVQAGCAYQRFALQATALNLRHAFINQPTEVLALRPKIAALIGIGDRRPNLIVRFGYGPLMPRSLRRPPVAVIDQV